MVITLVAANVASNVNNVGSSRQWSTEKVRSCFTTKPVRTLLKLRPKIKRIERQSSTLPTTLTRSLPNNCHFFKQFNNLLTGRAFASPEEAKQN